MLGIDFFPDEGLMNHSLHTAIINEQGKLVANIEGNQFTANQLANLVDSVIRQQTAPKNRSPNTGPAMPMPKPLRPRDSRRDSA